MTGSDFVDIAGKLLASASNPTPALCRTIISRAYYGAFHLARAYLRELGFSPGNNHRDTLHPVQVVSDVNAREAGKRLSDLQTHRIKADYDLSDTICHRVEVVREQVENAAEVRVFLDRCLQEPARSQIKAEIEAYQKRLRGV